MYICLYKKNLCPNINKIKCLHVSQPGFLVASNRKQLWLFLPKSTWISAIMMPQQPLYAGCQSWNHYFRSWMLDIMMSFSGTSNWILVVATARVNSLVTILHLTCFTFNVLSKNWTCMLCLHPSYQMVGKSNYLIFLVSVIRDIPYSPPRFR